MRAVTAEAVHAAAQEWLDKRRSVTGYLVRDEAARRRKALVIDILRIAHASAVSPARAARCVVAASRRSATTKIERVVSPAASRPGWCATPPCRWSRCSSPSRGGASQDPADKPGLAT